MKAKLSEATLLIIMSISYAIARPNRSFHSLEVSRFSLPIKSNVFTTGSVTNSSSPKIQEAVSNQMSSHSKLV